MASYEEENHLHCESEPCYKSMKTIAELDEFGFSLLPHPPCCPDPASKEYWLFADLKMLQGKIFCLNEELILAPEGYVEVTNKSFYHHDIEKLEKLWNDWISLEGDYIDG